MTILFYTQNMEKQEIRTFGRRHGKRLSARQAWLTEHLLPKITPNKLIAKSDMILEIGFGAGEHLLDLAMTNPDSIVIGAEPYINGVASLLSSMTTTENAIKDEYKNIKIWPDDVRKLLSRSDINFNFSKIFILHPDPWPKARHEKRRLLNAEFLNLLANKLKPDGQIIIGTDHHDYYDWIKEQIKKTDLIISNSDLPIIETRYNKKDMFGAGQTLYLTISKN